RQNGGRHRPCGPHHVPRVAHVDPGVPHVDLGVPHVDPGVAHVDQGPSHEDPRGPQHNPTPPSLRPPTPHDISATSPIHPRTLHPQSRAPQRTLVSSRQDTRFLRFSHLVNWQTLAFGTPLAFASARQVP